MAAPSIPTLESNRSDRASVNQENAQHSTGPRTESGKERVRLNALKHGIYAKVLVLPSEDQACFEACRAILTERYNPQTEAEIALVETLNETGWRLNRIVGVEANLLTIGAQEYLEHAENRFGPIEPAALLGIAQALAYGANSRIFGHMHIQESRLRRLYDATLKQLKELIAGRQVAEAAASPEAAAENGFVPSFSPEPAPRFTGPLADIKRKQWIRQQASFAGLK